MADGVFVSLSLSVCVCVVMTRVHTCVHVFCEPSIHPACLLGNKVSHSLLLLLAPNERKR